MSASTFAERPLPIAEHDCPVKMIRFSRSGYYMATGDTDLQIKVWHDGKEVFHIDPRLEDDKIRPTQNIRGIEFSADEKLIYVAASDTVNAYEIASGDLVWKYRPDRFFGFLIASPQALAVSTTGRLAVACDYGSMALFEADGSVVYRKRDNYVPRWLGFSPSGQTMVGVDAFNLCVWDVETGTRIHRWALDNKVYGMAVSPRDSLVVTRELHTLSIFDFDQFHRICEVPAGEGLPAVAFSPTEPILASAEKTRVRLIDSECRGVQNFDADGRTVLTVAFSPDGSKVLAGCTDGQVVSWYRDMPDLNR